MTHFVGNGDDVQVPSVRPPGSLLAEAEVPTNPHPILFRPSSVVPFHDLHLVKTALGSSYIELNLPNYISVINSFSTLLTHTQHHSPQLILGYYALFQTVARYRCRPRRPSDRRWMPYLR